MATVSAVLITRNEERNLPQALRSLRWVDDLVVVDGASTDRTAEIARSFGARVFVREPRNAVDEDRAFSVEQAGGDWVFALDADEMVPASLARRLRALADGGTADAYRIPRLNHVFGRPLRGGMWAPSRDRPLRFFRKGSVELGDALHSFIRPAPGARVEALAVAPGDWIVHFAYRDVAQHLEKMNRYTTIEARQALERGERPRSTPAGLARAAARFFLAYARGGWRDGWRGAYLAA